MTVEQPIETQLRRRTIGWALLLAVVIAVALIGVNSFATWTPLDTDGPIVVRVTGHEFFWKFRFPGPDGNFDTTDDTRVEKELHLPRNRDVTFFVTSDDYVYTLSIPGLQVRHIAVPELIYTVEFTPNDTGRFDILADPLCGERLWHDEYMGSVVVESESEFESWYTGNAMAP